LSVNEKRVVFGKSFIKSLPNRNTFVGEYFGKSFPENLFFSLLTLLFFFIGQEVRFLFQSWVSNKVLIVELFFSSAMEIL